MRAVTRLAVAIGLFSLALTINARTVPEDPAGAGDGRSPVVAGTDYATSPTARKIIDPLPLEPPEPPTVTIETANAIDRFIAKRWQEAGLRPVKLADPFDYIRRVTLDLVGRIPTFEEVDAYVSGPRKDRDLNLVNRLLASREYAEHWAIFWGDLLLEQYRIDGVENNAYREFILKSLEENKPYDRWVREMIAARGMVRDNPAAAFILRHKADPDELTIAATQVFLGTQLKCAQCHDHPFEAWKQTDFIGMRDFWGSTRRRLGRVETVTNRDGREEQVRYDQIVSGPAAGGAFLTGAASEKGGGVDGLADLITARDNPYFARVAVNRLWAKMFGRGLVEPVDGFKPDNPPSHPELLDHLAWEFITHDYDLKHILRLIALSRTYHLDTAGPPAAPSRSASRGVAGTQAGGPFFERMPLRRMTAEQLHDSIIVATGLDRRGGRGAGNPRESDGDRMTGGQTGETRFAIDIRYPAPGGSFLSTFGSHDRNTIHERDPAATIPQALALLNGELLNDAVQLHDGHPVRRWLRRGDSVEMALRRLWVHTVTREPTPAELSTATRYINADRRESAIERAFADVHWALINTREFMFIR
ncbi:MAG: hypothetical protein FLDDKLPJ_02630 [Phycisphaerae bacterium]|nr:hypothetical protein [Phycisphaerae bacterium]